jgi:hypothetical protein
MPSYDRISGDYHLDTLSAFSGLGDMYFTANAGLGTVYINGNLVVISDYSTYQTINSVSIDRYITLGSNTPAGLPSLDGGIKLERGSGKPTVSIKWNESLSSWQVTNDGSTFANIYGKEPVLSEIEEDLSPRLGSHLNTQGYFIFSPAGNNIIFNAGYTGTGPTRALQINHLFGNANVSFIDSATVVYGDSIRSGGSGLYITDNLNRNEELVSKRRSVIFSLVL